MLLSGNGVSAYYLTQTREYSSNASFKRGSFSGASADAMSSSGVCATSSDAVYQANGDARRAGSKSTFGANGKSYMANAVTHVISSVSSSYNDSSVSRNSRPEKKRKVAGTCLGKDHEESTPDFASEGRVANGASDCQYNPKLSSTTELTNRHGMIAPAFAARKLLIVKARKEILKKLEEMRLASEAAAAIEKNFKSGQMTGSWKLLESLLFFLAVSLGCTV